MRYPTKRLLGLICGLSMLAGGAQGQLVINMDYSAFTTGPTGNVNSILKGAGLQDAIAAMDQAAAIWEDVFANSSSSLSWASNGVLTRNINVSWTSHGGNTLARGGTPFFSNGQWAGDGTLRWDGDGSSDFFVDTTPGDDSEWRQSSERSQSLGGVLVNVERVSYDAPAGTVRDGVDFLSTALHEIGHTFGFSSGYPLFDDADLGNDSDIDIIGGPLNGADIPVNSSHVNLSIGSPGNDSLGTGRSDYPYDPGGNSFFPNSTYNPANLAPSTTPGVRMALTEADIAIAAQFLDFDMATINYDPNPGSGIVLGDLNGDGALTNDDISLFVQALTDAPGYAAAFPGLDPNELGDFTGDGILNNADIQGFVDALDPFGGVVPEPTSLALLGLGGLLATRRRR